MDDNILRIGEREIKAFSERNPADIPWGDGVDIVVESSGVFTDRDSAAGHLEGGAKKVVISAPAKGADATFVYKVNHESYDPENHHVVSNSSCTTNCIIPMEGVAGQLRDRVGLHDDLPRLHQRPEPHRLGAQRPQAPGPPPRTSSRPPRGPLVRPV